MKIRHPGHIAMTASVLLAVTVAALTACTSRPHAGQTAPPAATATAPAGPGGPADDHGDEDDGVQPDTSASADPAAVDVITAFATAWARPGLDQPRWYTDVARYATPTYAELLATVDPAKVPATQITSTPTVTTATATAVVGTDAGPITITCARYNGRWLVVDVEPPERPTAAATP